MVSFIRYAVAGELCPCLWCPRIAKHGCGRMSRENKSSGEGRVLKGLLEHAEREYKEAGWQGKTSSSDAARGPGDKPGLPGTSGTFPEEGARSTASSRPSDEDRGSADPITNGRNRGSPMLRSSSVGTGISSRKRPRADISGGRSTTGRKSSSGDGSTLARQSSGDTEAAAEKSAGTTPSSFFLFGGN